MPKLAVANWNPVTFQPQLSWMKTAPQTVFVHTNGGGADLAGKTGYFSNSFNNPADRDYHVGVGATFQVYWDGSADQLCDSEQIIWAEFGASEWAASIETQDDGNHLTPWTDPQLQKIADIITALGVPTHLMSSPTSAGVGYHQMWTPTWNNNFHDCPGPVRTKQLVNEILPQLLAHVPDVVVSRLPLLVPGDVGHISEALAARALLNASTPFGGRYIPMFDPAHRPLGYPKNDTQMAFTVGHFQATHGLQADMKIGPRTWQALLDIRDRLPLISRDDPTHWGQYLRNLRWLLVTTGGYYLLPTDGTSWDDNVQNCLIDFQTKHGLVADGIVGALTWAPLLGLPGH